MRMVNEFKEFLLKQNIIALAIAVVVGTALNTLVKSLVDGFIMPILLVVQPGGDWQTAKWTVGPFTFGLGGFLAALINFIIVGFVAWRISKLFIRDVPKKDCPYCRMSIDAAAIRCPNCTSQLAPA
ncbi:MAG: MscL family protein [Gemmatimonadaceae bacterium]|jgi:large conductance mechanosensitive channel